MANIFFKEASPAIGVAWRDPRTQTHELQAMRLALDPLATHAVMAAKGCRPERPEVVDLCRRGHTALPVVFSESTANEIKSSG